MSNNALENQGSRYGAIAQMLPFTPGKVFFVLDSADSWTSDFLYQYPTDIDGNVRVFTDIPSALAATVSGRNDVIVLDSNTSHTLTSMLTVSNNKVHFVSMDWLGGVRRVQDQRCRVQMGVTAAATDVATIKVSGSGCSFRGIKFINSNTLTQSVQTFIDESPDGLLVENCSIHALGSAQLTATGGSALRLAGDTSMYINSEIGADTIINTVANQVVNIATIDGAVARRVLFDNCVFRTWSSASTHVFARTQAATDIDRDVTFRRCTFSNFNAGGGTALAVAIASNVTGGFINIDQSSFFNTTKVATAAAGNSNVLIVASVPTASTSGIGIAPTT